MNLMKLTRKASGRLYNAVKKEDGGFENPLVEFEGVDLDNLPSVEDLLNLCGSRAAIYLADGYNTEAFDLARDPFDKWIPDTLDDDQAKALRTALINISKALGKTPDEAAQMLNLKVK
jgi:hypothetical protein